MTVTRAQLYAQHRRSNGFCMCHGALSRERNRATTLPCVPGGDQALQHGDNTAGLTVTKLRRLPLQM
jgi:hypothetical protein